MEFVCTFIAVLIGLYIGRFLATKESGKSQNELLDEVRKLCNELLKIKDKGTIVITNLSMSKEKGPNRVVVTTLPVEKYKKQ
jgi:hypothetical protein